MTRGWRPSRRAFVLLWLAGGALVGLVVPARRLADASSYVIMADSLWHDGDLRYTTEDLRRGRELRFDDFPAGLFLTRRGGEYFYAKPPVYPLAAAPFLALLGVRGFFVMNGVLLASLVLLGADIVSHRLGWKAALATSGLAFGFSVTPAYLMWIDPFLLYTTLVAAGVAAWRRDRPILCAAALTLVACGRLPYGALLAAPAALYASARRWRDLVRFVGTAGVLLATLLALARLETGQWSPYMGDRYWYPSAVPFANGADEGVGIPISKAPLLTDWQTPALRDVAANAGTFVFGRFSGLLLYFPTFFACGLWALGGDREKAAWLGAVAAVCALLQAALPHNPFGGSHALGNRLFVLLPVALILVDAIGWLPWRIGLTGLLLLLVVPVLRAPVYFSLNPGRQMLQLPYRWFPLELRQARGLLFPYRFPGLMALTPNQFDWEPAGGVWTVGGTKAEFVLVRPASASAVAVVGLSSPLPTARVSDGTVERDVHFSPGKVETLELAPRAVTRDECDGFHRYHVYHLTVQTPGGITPAVTPGTGDHRPLGVFVQPLS